ncbi:BRCT domain-containing protein At4g02110-like [Durio zibethinus]|uniref:BRCT domain-containing protein At4g02110-like n=1 Tax=Durio zibethinus TaxID=66656 RepID=A0A6P6A3U8_DURZI|nr:BRCT domain-containing protein At4g02110-like [Durio zibethinus]
MPVDPTSIMYKPLRDLNGIPGAKSLIVCLTGYQRQDRDDIMTMVSLMGAQFSKPLVANKVTHLICYKFEGEKYELAKKIRKIKLINHRWLEDCLREWELLSEANYSKSGYELEVMEAEAKDSEEEAEETTWKESGQKSLKRSSHNLKAGMLSSSELPNSAVEVSMSTMPRYSPNTKEVLLTPGKSHQGTSSTDVNDPKLHAFQDSGLGNASSIKLAEQHNRSPNSTNVDINLASNSKSPSLSNEKFTAISYSRKTPRKSPGKSTPPNLSGEISGNFSGSPQAMRIKDAFGIPSSKMQQTEERINSCFVKSPRKGADLCHEEDSAGILPQKRALELSACSSKTQKTTHNGKAAVEGSALDTERLEPTSLAGDQLQINDCSVDGTSYLNVLHNSCASNATTKLSNDSSSFKTVTAEDRMKNSDEKSPKMSFKGYGEFTLAGKPDLQHEKSPEMSFNGLRESTIASRSNLGDSGLERCVQVIGEPGKLQNKFEDVEVPSIDDRKLGMENSHSPATLDLLERGSDKLVTKLHSKKMLAKKTLGSRSKLSNVANRKGSIYSSKIASENDLTICLDGANERATHKSASELETPPPTINLDDVVEKVVSKSLNAATAKTQFRDDETQAPDEEDENDAKKTPGKEKSELVESTCKADTLLETEHVRCDSKVAVGSVITSKNGTNGNDPERAVSCKNSELGESTLKCFGLKKKTSKRKKQLSGKAKMKVVPSQSKDDLVGDDTSVGKNIEEKDDEKENFIPHPATKTSSSNASLKVENARGAGKSSPVGPEEIPGKSVKPNKKAVKTNEKSQKVDSKTQLVQKVFNRLKTEPVWFILSGHRLQRKEFQQVIRRLKGKFCRDSHQWSYQATHFIAPDPIRRTEKFFAAAASGRWILKPDYLSACNQAGKFLAEEPYEWHNSGLSEDGAINLEASRKWRHLRERTGHGAFYGMRIIVYGECIAPPLDTLKRVVKAGDGTILATSPPYTRFLKSGVDFAVVSPGMPRVDSWVQDFLKHEIPCIVADYLVEYVCKAGYSLDRHVLYNSHEWAEKSFSNLRSRAEEIVEDVTTPQPPDDCGSNDVACQVCGSRERGDAMLICGDESGSVGCGVGIHIDCCDPPLEDVPEEDWFCPKCSQRSRNSTTPSKKRKKGTSQSKDK